MKLILFNIFLLHIGKLFTCDAFEASGVPQGRPKDPIKTSRLQQALIFNQQIQKLDDIHDSEGRANCPCCIIACPAETEEEKIINQQSTLSKNSIFSKTLNKKSQPTESIRTIICKDYVKPAILFNQTTQTFETGYELYYEEENFDLKSEKYFFQDFKPISEVSEYSMTSPVKSNDAKKSFVLSNDRIFTFYWVSVLSLKFDSSKYQIRATIKSDVVNDYRYRGIQKCYYYDLGYELYGSELAKSVNLFNLKFSNQEEMFESVYIRPELKPEQQNGVSQNQNQSESPFVQSYGLIEGTHLVPLMFLHSGTAKLASCTFLNIIPVWTDIIRGQLKLVDRYLYTIFRKWSPEVNIIFGVSGKSKVKVTESSWIKSEGTMKINTNEPYEFSFPKLIYRIVEYGTPQNMSNAVIVIHNDRTASKKDRICEYPSAGWETITNDDPKKGLTYVCPLIPDVNKQLGVYDKLPSGFTKTLNLAVTIVRKVNDQVKYTDERKNVENEMKELFPERKSPDSELDPVTPESKPESENVPKSEFKSEPDSKPKAQSKPEVESTPNVGVQYEPWSKPETQSKPKLAPEPYVGVVYEPQSKLKSKSQPKVVYIPYSGVEYPPGFKPKTRSKAKLKSTPNLGVENEPDTNQKLQSEPRLESTPNLGKENEPNSKPKVLSEPEHVSAPNLGVEYEPDSKPKVPSEPERISTPNLGVEYEPDSKPKVPSEPELVSTPNLGVEYEPESKPKIQSNSELESTSEPDSKFEDLPEYGFKGNCKFWLFDDEQWAKFLNDAYFSYNNGITV